MKTVSIKLPPRLEARLAAAVARRRTTRSRLVREILERHLVASEPTPESALARAGDIVGSVKRKPRDLSTNPKHLRGFGR
jgi:metal-responsive CopG/Arc/MetJ family transcriptional regulator